MKTERILSICWVFCALVFLMVEPALAQSTGTGGLERVNTFAENVLNILRGVSVAVVTIAIIVAGYRYLFTHADIADVAKIVIGGLLIGGAAEIARFMLEG